MRVVERNNTCIRPHHWVRDKLIWAEWFLWKRFRHEGDVVWLRVTPAFLELRMPEWKILQSEDLPHTIFLDVLILIDAALPPLHKSPRVRILDTIMCTGGHHASKATLGSCAIGVDVDDALNLRMIEEEAVHRTIPSSYKTSGKAADVEPLDTFSTIVPAA